MFKKILFATTVTPDCDDAAKYAFDLAMKYSAPLCIFHVFGIPSRGYSQNVINLKTGEKEEYCDEHDKIVTEEIEKAYDEQFEIYQKTEVTCTVGTPSTEILRKVKKDKIDLIVMGAHTQITDSEARRYRNVTGDTFQKVAKKAQCPVLVVSRPYQQNFWDLNNILFATDLSRATMSSFRFALRLAQENKSKLHIFHSLALSPQAPDEVIPQEELESRLKMTREKMQDLFVSEMGGFENYELSVWEGIPYVEILKYSREKQIDLITMASSSSSIFQNKETIGSTTEEVVLRSSCPIVSINRLDVLEEYGAFLAQGS